MTFLGGNCSGDPHFAPTPPIPLRRGTALATPASVAGDCGVSVLIGRNRRDGVGSMTWN